VGEDEAHLCVLLPASERRHICSIARSRAFDLHFSLMLSAGADHSDGMHSRLDHCMHCKRRLCIGYKTVSTF